MDRTCYPRQGIPQLERPSIQVKESKQYYRRKRRKLLEPKLHSSKAQSWIGADTPTPLRTITSPHSLFSKDMWAVRLRLGFAPIHRALEVRWGLLFVGGHFQWFLLPTFLWISYFQDHNTSIFTNINEFHEFWCTCDFKNETYKIEPQWEKSQAGWPRPGRPAYPYVISSCNSSEMVLNIRSRKYQVLYTSATS